MKQPGIDLQGRTALVTGGGRRLGRALARRLAAEGVGVVIHHHRSGEEAEGLAAEIGAAGGRAWTVAADLDRPEEAEGLVARAADLAGPLDLLVNNASIYPSTRAAELTPDNLAENVRINALAPFLLTRALAAAGRPAAVVNLLDARMVDYDHLHVPYHLSKRMLYTFTRMSALEYAPGLRVNGVAPGIVLPPEGQGQEYLDRWAHTNPLNACGAAEDVVSATLYLLTAPFVTGQVIYVDGGRHLHGSVY